MRGCLCKAWATSEGKSVGYFGLACTQPILPGAAPGLPEKAAHDYHRNGTTTLSAALEVATGKVIDRCDDRHQAEFLDFLKTVARTYPRRQLTGGTR